MPAVRRGTGALLMAALVGTLTPGVAAAASGRTVYVDDNGTASASAKGACGKPNFSTIQAAVNDVSTTTIVVCKGMYSEQVAVTRSLSLGGRAGATIQAPADLDDLGAIVLFLGAQKSRLSGFVISGASTPDPDLHAGVDVRDGAEVAINRNRIRDIRDVSVRSTQGKGIYVDGARAEITDNGIERFGTDGIFVWNPGGFATIEGNTIRGLEPDIIGGQRGIHLREGGRGKVEDNTITVNTNGTGILVSQTAAVLIRKNTSTGNAAGIILSGETSDIQVRGNTVRDNTSVGIDLADAGQNTVADNVVVNNGGDGIRVETFPRELRNVIAGNRVRNNDGDGIHIGRGAADNTVEKNRVRDNGGTDILDLNGEPLVNAYADNRCKTSNPDGLCDS